VSAPLSLKGIIDYNNIKAPRLLREFRQEELGVSDTGDRISFPR
jgi:hypothetical protein